MSELIKNEIGDNKISEKIGDLNHLEAKIKDSYKEIYEKRHELKSLQKEIGMNLSGERLKSLIESELTSDHVKSVLQQSLAKFSTAKPGIEGFNSVYSDMGAGLVFNLQLALAKLGAKFDNGIDGMYGSHDTRARVMEFQNAWNIACPEQPITADGRAGKATIEKIISALDDASRDKSKISRTPAAKTEQAPITAPAATQDTVKTTIDTATAKPVEVQQPAFVSEEEAFSNPAKYNLITTDGEHIEPAVGYEFADPNNEDNFATRKNGALDSLKKQLDPLVYGDTMTKKSVIDEKKVPVEKTPVKRAEAVKTPAQKETKGKTAGKAAASDTEKSSADTWKQQKKNVRFSDDAIQSRDAHTERTPDQMRVRKNTLKGPFKAPTFDMSDIPGSGAWVKEHTRKTNAKSVDLSEIPGTEAWLKKHTKETIKTPDKKSSDKAPASAAHKTPEGWKKNKASSRFTEDKTEWLDSNTTRKTEKATAKAVEKTKDKKKMEKKEKKDVKKETHKQMVTLADVPGSGAWMKKHGMIEQPKAPEKKQEKKTETPKKIKKETPNQEKRIPAKAEKIINPMRGPNRMANISDIPGSGARMKKRGMKEQPEVLEKKPAPTKREEKKEVKPETKPEAKRLDTSVDKKKAAALESERSETVKSIIQHDAERLTRKHGFKNIVVDIHGNAEMLLHYSNNMHKINNTLSTLKYALKRWGEDAKNYTVTISDQTANSIQVANRVVTLSAGKYLYNAKELSFTDAEFEVTKMRLARIARKAGIKGISVWKGQNIHESRDFNSVVASLDQALSAMHPDLRGAYLKNKMLIIDAINPGKYIKTPSGEEYITLWGNHPSRTEGHIWDAIKQTNEYKINKAAQDKREAINKQLELIKKQDSLRSPKKPTDSTKKDT